jgi:rare lipoprotein A
MRQIFILLLSACVPLTACAGGHQPHGKNTAAEQKKLAAQTGLASWYVDRRTASGEHYRAGALTAAHRTLPFGTRVRVTNLHNSRSVIVRITDRGPYKKKRVIDVSRAAASELGMIHSGVARVRLEILR